MNKENCVFNIGDKVTYKSTKDCTHSSGREDMYYYSGSDRGGQIGQILDIYDTDTIEVSGILNDCSYKMKVYEFLEYDILNLKGPIYELY